MKAIYRIIIAIFAVAALAVSCSKNAVPEGGAQVETGEVRVITLSFGGSTKSTLDGFTPKFSDSDRILLSNGSGKEECTVNVDASGKATVTTRLKGILKAVTPASAAVTDGGDLTYRIPVTQSGRFSDAAIATAQNIISAAEFEIQVSLLKFYVDQSISVHSITVESTQNIATAGSSNLKQITVGSGASYLHYVASDTQQRLCYAAVLPGVPASSLKFTSNTESQGTVVRQSPASTVTLAKNTLYKAFIPYYIKIKVSSDPDVYQRWGYCNIGAFLPEEPGKYFAWGDTDGQTWDGSDWSDGGFSTAPEVGNPVPSELPLQLDAAYVNWGGTWRLPTNSEYTALIDGTGTTTSDFVNTAEKKGLQIKGTGLFFPAAGYGKDNLLKNNDGNGTQGDYWSSTIGNATGSSYPYQLYFFFGATATTDKAINKSFCNTNCLRSLGESIRPIFDNSLTMEDYDDGGDI